jgi:hypothetical protein
LLLLGACKAVESPVRVTTFTVNAAVPTLTTGPNPIAAASAEVLVGQTGGGGWSTYGRAAVPASSFGSSVPVAGTLGCGSSIACTVVVRVRLLDASGVPFDSADTPAFTLAGGDTRTASGFEFRPVHRLVFLDTAIVLPMGVGRTVAVAVLDNADRPLVGRPLTFTSSDPSIVTVNAAGQVVGVRGGRAVVTAARESRTARVAVTVNMLQQFSLSAAAPNVMRTLTVRVIPTLQVAPGVSQRVRYTSSDSSVAIVDSTGLVTGRAEGTVTISGAPDADPTQVRSVSITVDPYRAASQYRYVNVMVRPEPSFSINGAWALQGNNVIVAGCGGIARWNGATWRYETNIGPCANAVTGTGDNNVYVLGPQSWRYNGTAWARESYTPPREILGAVTVENVIYAVGRDGMIVRNVNGTWSTMNSGVTGTLRAIDGVSGSTLWAVGDGGVVLRYDGMAWQTVLPAGGLYSECTAVHVRAANDVMLACNERGWGGNIQRWDGKTFERMEGPSRDLMNTIVEGAGQVYAAGWNNVVWRLEGSRWVSDAERVNDTGFRAGFVDAGGAMLFGGDGLVARRTASGWTVTHGSSGYWATWAGGPDLIMAAGGRGMVDLWDGSTWRNIRPFGAGQGIRALWGTGRNAVWAVGGNGAAVLYNGATWQDYPMPTTAVVSGVWGTTRDSVWAVTQAGEIFFWNGARWALTFRTGRTLNAIHGRDARNILAVGEDGRIWKFDGRAWTREESGTDQSLRAVFMGPTRAFVAAPTQLLDRRDGEWHVSAPFAGHNYQWITGSGDRDVYAGGCGNTTIRRFDGTQWLAEVPTNVTTCSNGGTVVPGGGLFIGGGGRDFISGTGPNGVRPGQP